MPNRTRPFLFLAGLAVTFPALLSAQDKPVAADELVKSAINARGGAARIKAVDAQRVTGTVSFGPGPRAPCWSN